MAPPKDWLQRSEGIVFPYGQPAVSRKSPRFLGRPAGVLCASFHTLQRGLAVKIAVCIKRTPDSESRFKIGGGGAGIDETGLKFDLDDFASYAVEVALQLNEKQGPGETV